MPSLDRRVTALLVCAVVALLLAIVGFGSADLPPPTGDAVPTPATVEASAVYGDAAHSESPAEGQTAATIARRTHDIAPLSVVIRDARTAEPLAGARLDLVSRKRHRLGSEISDADGSVQIERPAGWGGGVLVTREGYRPRAFADVEGLASIDLDPLEYVQVEVRGVPAHLRDHTDLWAQIDYRYLRAMPGNTQTRVVYEWFTSSSLAERVRIVDGRAEVPAVFSRPARVSILASHPPSGWVQQLACRDITHDQRSLEVRLSERLLRKTHMLFVRLHMPEDQWGPLKLYGGSGMTRLSATLTRQNREEPYTGWATGLAKGTYELRVWQPLAQGGARGTRPPHERKTAWSLGRTDVRGVSEIDLMPSSGARVVLRLAGIPERDRIRPELTVFDDAGLTPPHTIRGASAQTVHVGGLAPGDYTFRVSALGLVSLPTRANVAVGPAPTELAIDLRPACEVSVILPTRRGHANSHLEVVDLDGALPVPLAPTQRDIPYDISHVALRLPHGIYSVAVSFGARRVQRDVRLDGAQRELDFR